MSELAITDSLDAASSSRWLNLRANSSARGWPRAGCWLDRFVFGSLLGLLLLVAIPYGSVEPWWIAVYEVAIFSLAGLAIITQALTSDRGFSFALLRDYRMFLPLAALLVFIFLQSVSLPQTFWNLQGSISSDPFETRLVFLKLLVLVINAGLLILFASNRRRLRLLVNGVIAVAVACAVFGIVRLALQTSDVGFGLSHLRRDSGFGQFINKNHFAFLMEMGIGLATGLLVAGGVKRERRLIYCAALLVMWAALVETVSRGAVFSMLTQLVFLLTAMIWLRSNETNNSEAQPALSSTPLISRPDSRRTLPRRALLGISLVALILLGTVWLGGDLLVTRMESLSSELRIETDAANALHAGVKRREIWGATWRLAQSSPLLGVGFGAYGVAITRFHNASGKWVPEAAHNDYLELLSAGGLLGTALVVWFAVSFIRSARTQLLVSDHFRRAACLAALTGLLGVMAHSVVDFGLHILANAVVFVVLLVVATKKLPATTQEEVFD